MTDLREIARMTDFEWLKIIALATPFFILLMVLLMIPLTRWQDAREDRRNAARGAGASRTAAE
jgi:hypothetical protein